MRSCIMPEFLKHFLQEINSGTALFDVSQHGRGSRVRTLLEGCEKITNGIGLEFVFPWKSDHLHSYLMASN